MKSFKNIKKAAKVGGISWITIWLIVAAIVFFSVIGYAAYTRVIQVKRVVSTKAGAGLLFSSNYMANGNISTIEYDDIESYPGDKNPTYTATVCNYAQGDRSTWYTSSNIEYVVHAEIFLNQKYTAQEAAEAEDSSLEGKYKHPSPQDLDGKVFGVRYGPTGDFSYFTGSTISYTFPSMGTYSLSKDALSTHTFDVVFDKSELLKNTPGFWIQLTAVPKHIVVGEVAEISGYIGACKSASGAASWTGYINDADYTTTDYDAYNYIVSGTGTGTFYFAWDDSKVRPNEFAFINYGSGTELSSAALDSFNGYTQYGSTQHSVANWKYVSFPVDSNRLPRYEFQLYKTSADDYRSVISTYVDYKFTTN